MAKKPVELRKRYESIEDKCSMFRPGVILGTQYIGKNLFKRFVSDGIRTFEHEKDERGFLSHIVIVVHREAIPYKELREAETKWVKKGFNITDETVWVAESTIPKSGIAPLDALFTMDKETVAFDWVGLPPYSPVRLQISNHAMCHLGERYPVENLGLFALDRFTRIVGIRPVSLLKKSVMVCSQWVGHVVSIPTMEFMYGHMCEDGKVRLLLGYTPNKPGDEGTPVEESTPDDWFDEAYQNDEMFHIIFSTIGETCKDDNKAYK